MFHPNEIPFDSQGNPTVSTSTSVTPRFQAWEFSGSPLSCVQQPASAFESDPIRFGASAPIWRRIFLWVKDLHLIKNIFHFSPVGLEGIDFTTGNIVIFPRGLNQMEEEQAQSTIRVGYAGARSRGGI